MNYTYRYKSTINHRYTSWNWSYTYAATERTNPFLTLQGHHFVESFVVKRGWIFCFLLKSSIFFFEIIVENALLKMLVIDVIWFHDIYPTIVICLVVWNMALIFSYIGNFIIPTDELIFFRGVETTNQFEFSSLYTVPSYHPNVS